MQRPDLATRVPIFWRPHQGNLAFVRSMAKIVFACCAVASVVKSSLNDETMVCHLRPMGSRGLFFSF